MDEENMKLAVKRGAYFLDERYPNWASAINLDNLVMDDCERCIVGQAIGDYGQAIGKAAGVQPYTRDSHHWAVDHGFDLPDDIYNQNDQILGEQFYELEGLWADQVRDRL